MIFSVGEWWFGPLVCAVLLAACLAIEYARRWWERRARF